jgi:hypothetical protein
MHRSTASAQDIFSAYEPTAGALEHSLPGSPFSPFPNPPLASGAFPRPLTQSSIGRQEMLPFSPPPPLPSSLVPSLLHTPRGPTVYAIAYVTIGLQY